MPASYYRYSCGHVLTKDPWRGGLDVEEADVCHQCRLSRVGETVRFARFGEPPVSGRSRNYRDSLTEAGVSVYEIVNGAIQYKGWYFDFLTRPLYTGTGTITGFGSDGEPVVKILTCRKANRIVASKLLAV